jgi:diaminopimelate epimerase
MHYSKYHALGNDYIVLAPEVLSTQQIQLICHRHFGIGSDGILMGPFPSEVADFGLRIFNPDGSEAEKSGNGLRIFSRYLWDHQQVQPEEFTIETPGGIVRSRVKEEGKTIQVEMGKVSFWSDEIPVSGSRREVINEPLTIQSQILGSETFTICAATVGNPHCVIVVPEVRPELAKQWGPEIEVNPLFPNRTNVQFLQVKNRQTLQLEIWERGAGYTLASGSSSSAAAAVAYRLGLCDSSVTVVMPGGELFIEISPDYSIVMTGEVTRVAEGILFSEVFDQDLNYI